MAEKQIRQDLLTGLKVQYGTTKIENETVTFLWVIDDFMKTTKDGKDAIKSPLFDNLPRSNHKWQVRFRPKQTDGKQEHSSIYLYLMDFDNSESQPESPPFITARFQISLVDSDGNQAHSVGGRSASSNNFHHRSGWGFNRWLSINELKANPAHYLPSGRLVVRCQIWIEGTSKQNLCTGARYLSVPKQATERDRLAVDFGNLLQREDFTDVSFIVSASTIRAHKCFLASRSKVFHAMFSNESYMETVESSVKIEDFDADVIKAMLEFIYTGKVAPDLLKERATDILVVADKYDIPGLKKLADHSMGENVSVDNAVQILKLAELYGCKSLKEHVLAFLKRHLPEVAKSVFAQEFVQANPQTVMEFFISHF